MAATQALAPAAAGAGFLLRIPSATIFPLNLPTLEKSFVTSFHSQLGPMASERPNPTRQPPIDDKAGEPGKTSLEDASRAKSATNDPSTSKDQDLLNISREAPETITLQLRYGRRSQWVRKWIFPWAYCKTWKGLEELLREAFDDSPTFFQKVVKGNFAIHGPDDAVIVPPVWESLAEPGWKITIKFPFNRSPRYPPPGTDKSSDSDDSDDSGKEQVRDADVKGADEEKQGDGELQKTARNTNIRYNVEHYQRIPFQRHLVFLKDQDYDGPVVFHDSKDKTTALVLQETVKLVRDWKSAASAGGPPRPARASKQEKTSSKPETLMPGDKITERYLTIHSPFLLNALRDLIKYSSAAPSGNKDPLKDGKFLYPYMDLYHHKDILLEYKDRANPTRVRHSEEYNSTCNCHIDILVDYLYGQENIRLKQAEEGWSKKVPTTTFGCFWLLMKSGTDVYVKEHGLLNAYVVESLDGGVLKEGTVESYRVHVWNLSFDGSKIARELRTIEVPVFDGEREISSLPLIPVRLYNEVPGEPSLREQLVSRGKRYVELTKGPVVREYSGEGLDSGSRTYDRARVVIDHKRESIVTSHRRPIPQFIPPPPPPPTPPAYDSDSDSDTERRPIRRSIWRSNQIGARARVPGCQCEKCEVYNSENQIFVPLTFASYDNINPKLTDNLSEHQYFLCDSHLWGYILSDRIYDLLNVKDVVEPKMNVHAIDKLVMRTESAKATIKAICKAYTSTDVRNKPYVADLIQGKGEGQIILLHGPPGTGKTLTAESVAEYTGRPLLTITAADLGHNPISLERNLLTFFRDANDWDAIVLLDEADVYLEKRGIQDLKRNSIVSVFLRALDYFRGILFLTTNRVGSFDEAFMSRIHVQIGYDPLDNDARNKIWDNNFNKLKEDYEQGEREIRYDWDAKEYVKRSEEVKELNWNGREIRNAFQTSVALALFDAQGKEVPVIKESHFRQVVSMSRAFKDYIKSTHEDMDDAEIAYKSGLRYDNYNDSAPNQKQVTGHGKAMAKKR